MANAVTAISEITDKAVTGGDGNKLRYIFKVFTAEPVGTTTTVDTVYATTSLGLMVTEYEFFGLWVKLAGSGTKAVDIKILQSWDQTDADFVIPDAGGTVATGISDGNPHIYQLAPSPMPYLRIRATGTGSNDASTTITAYLFVQS